MASQKHYLADLAEVGGAEVLCSPSGRLYHPASARFFAREGSQVSAVLLVF